MTVAVEVAAPSPTPFAELAFTENVSEHGARVLISRPRQANDQLRVYSLAGDFWSLARVVYCQLLGSAKFAIGVKFLQPRGRWMIRLNNGWGDS